MSEQNDKNMRRVGRSEQKDELKAQKIQFPSEDEDLAIDFDVNSLPLPESDADALKMLSSLEGVVKAPKITPQEERYPPLRPVVEDAPQVIENPQGKESPAPIKSENTLLYNLLTFVFVLATIALCAWMTQVWIDPQTALNPFSPATPFVVVTATQDTGQVIIATPDDSGQVFVVITDTPASVESNPNTSPYPFIAEEILYAPNTNAFACNWWSIAGTVRDTNGNAIDGYRVRVTGDEVNETVFSGASQAFGAGGFELPLVGTPQVANFTVQLFSPQDAPLSDAIEVETRADCEGNVLIISFIQNR